MSQNALTLLVVEDDFVDVEILKRSVVKGKWNWNLVTHVDGSSALQYLRSPEFAEDGAEQLIILLDINMPGMNGHQFLDELRSDPDLRRCIVFVLTTSEHPRDRFLAYERNVAGYVVKSQINELLKLIDLYHRTVLFPTESNGFI